MALWTPAEIATALWLDFADNATVFSTETGSTLSSNGGPVGRIEDKSGKARHYAQNTISEQPTYVAPPSTLLVNGRAYSTWDGATTTGDRLPGNTAALATLNNVPAIAAFLVCKPDSVAATTRRPLVFNTNGSTTNRRFSILFTGSKYTVEARRGDADTMVTLSSPNDYTADWAIIESLADLSLPNTDTNGLQLIINGTVVAATALPGTRTTTQNNNSSSTRLGMLGGTGHWFQGAMGELVILTALPTLDTRQRIQWYLASKWGLVDKLPANHPYRIKDSRRRRASTGGYGL